MDTNPSLLAREARCCCNWTGAAAAQGASPGHVVRQLRGQLPGRAAHRGAHSNPDGSRPAMSGNGDPRPDSPLAYHASEDVARSGGSSDADDDPTADPRLCVIGAVSADSVPTPFMMLLITGNIWHRCTCLALHDRGLLSKRLPVTSPATELVLYTPPMQGTICTPQPRSGADACGPQRYAGQRPHQPR